MAPSPLVVATAGHVDHGKSTLVRALTGTDPDRLAEEQRRGMTIDLGFAFTTLPSGRALAFVDVPGHIRFLRTMLAGVGAVDAALLVVDAVEGWREQSEEHLRILELLGVADAVIAITKAGKVDDDQLASVSTDVGARLAASSLAGAPILVTDAIDDRGLDALRAALDSLPAGGHHATDRGRPRLWIDRAFTIRGAGTVVTGTLTGGTIALDERMALGVGGAEARVRGLQTAGIEVASVGPGQRVAVNLSGVDAAEVHRGTALVRPGQWHPVTVLDAELAVLDALDHDVARRGAHLLDVGSAEQAVQLRVLGTSAIAPGASGMVRLHLASPLPLLPGDRFVVRDAGRGETVGGGTVLDVDPQRPASRAKPTADVDRVVQEWGWISVDDLERRTGERRAADVGRWVVASDALADARARLHTRLTDAGPTGVELSSLDERERLLLDHLQDVRVHGTRAVHGDADPLEHEPWLAGLRRAPFNPPAVTDVDPAVVRDLLATGKAIELAPGIVVAAEVPAAAARILAAVATGLDGLTVAEVRDALRSTRRVVVPLLEHLETTGRTQRLGDRHLPTPPRAG